MPGTTGTGADRKGSDTVDFENLYGIAMGILTVVMVIVMICVAVFVIACTIWCLGSMF